jgi:hypothetical protein
VRRRSVFQSFRRYKMQITVNARLVYTPVTEAVDAENDDLRIVQLIKTLDCIPDVLKIVFRKSPIQIVRYDGGQRMIILLGTIVQHDGAPISKIYDHIPVDFRICTVEDLACKRIKVFLGAVLQESEAGAAKSRDGAGLLTCFLAFSLITGAFAVLNVFDEKSYVIASAVSELYVLTMMSLVGYLTYYLAYRNEESNKQCP